MLAALSMRTITVSFLVAALSVATGGGPVHAHDSKKHNELAQSETAPTIGATKLNDTLTMLSGVGGFTGGNVVVSHGKDGMLIIDDKLPSMTELLKDALGKIGDAASLKFVLNTHWHFDHAGGNAEFGKSATIVAHSNVRKRLSSDQRIDIFDMNLPAGPASALPVITFDDSLSIHFNDEEIRVIHMSNSHTDTDSVIYFTKSNVLHTGDLFFNGLFPFVDIQNGGDVENLAINIEKILSMFPADMTIVPGHGPIAKVTDIKKYHRMLIETIANVQSQIKGNKTLDQIKASGVPKEWAGWGWRIDQATWNSIVYASLMKSR